MAGTGLTAGQARCKSVIADFIAKNGVAPSRLELAAGLGLKSIGHVNNLIDQLVERGHAKRLVHRPRGLVLIHDICPCCGHERQAA